MGTRTRRQWIWAVAVGIMLMAVVAGAYAASTREPVASVTLSDGTVYTNVSVVKVDFNMVLLSFTGGGAWVSLDSLSDEARTALGLRTRAEETSFQEGLSTQLSDWRDVNDNAEFSAWLMDKHNEDRVNRIGLLREALRSGDAKRVAEIMKAWKTDQKAATQERLDREAREAHWRDEAAKRLAATNLTDSEKASYLEQYVEDHEAIRREREERWRDEARTELAGSNHQVTVTESDGTTVTKESLRLTAAEKNRYLQNYVKDEESAFTQEEADAKAARKAKWQEEAKSSLEGSSHEVSFKGRDGTTVRKDSSDLNGEEKALYASQYADEHETRTQERADAREAREALLREEARANFEKSLGNHEVASNQKELYLRRYLENHQRLTTDEIRQSHEQRTSVERQRSTAEQKDMSDPRNQSKQSTSERSKQQEQQTNQVKRTSSSPQTKSSTATTNTGQSNK